VHTPRSSQLKKKKDTQAVKTAPLVIKGKGVISVQVFHDFFYCSKRMIYDIYLIHILF